MNLNKLNLFKRTTNVELQLDSLAYRLENAHKLIFAIATVMNINPKLLKEYSQDQDKLTNYLIEMVKDDQKTNKKN